jgi:hypothetical protein
MCRTAGDVQPSAHRLVGGELAGRGDLEPESACRQLVEAVCAALGDGPRGETLDRERSDLRRTDDDRELRLEIERRAARSLDLDAHVALDRRQWLLAGSRDDHIGALPLADERELVARARRRGQVDDSVERQAGLAGQDRAVNRELVLGARDRQVHRDVIEQHLATEQRCELLAVDPQFPDGD